MSGLGGANLVLRFLLELAALGAVGYWGFSSFEEWPLKLLAGIALPVVMAVVWGVFRVPGDGGAPVVAVPTQARLILEFVFFALAIFLLDRSGQRAPALVFLALVLLNYGIDYDRTIRFLSGRNS
jgi:hypothetical protein